MNEGGEVMKAILLMTYGSLKSIDDLPAFYTHIFHGQRPSPDVLIDGTKRFRSIGTPDPLGSITDRQAAALEQRLLHYFGERIKVYQAMKHTPPFIEDTIRQIIEDGVTELYTLPLSPLHSRTGTDAYHRQVRKALAAIKTNINVVEITQWHLFPGIIEAIAKRLRAALQWLSAGSRAQATVLFTAHSQPGLPEANLAFIQSFTELAQAVAELAGSRQWRLAYRSAGPAPQKWLQPDVLDRIEEVAKEGGKAVIICELLSLTENVEALYDCRIHARLKAEACGLEFVAAEFLNDSADYMDALAHLIYKRMIEQHSI